MTGQLGITSYIYYWAICYRGITAEELVDKTDDLGLQVLQICDNLPLIGLTTAQLDSLRDHARQKNVSLEVGTRGYDLHELKAYLQIAKHLGSTILRFVPWRGPESEPGFDMEELADFLREAIPDCQENGVRLALENHAEIADEDLVSLVNKVQSPYLGICLDTTNSTGLLQKPADTARLLAPYALSLHLKDLIINRKFGGKGFSISGIPLGQGSLDLLSILDIVHRQDRALNTLLELWVDPCETEQETINKEDLWIRESVAFARKIFSPNQGSSSAS